MHIADAKGEDGEGVQIGDGDIDIQELSSLLSIRKRYFIPEIWKVIKIQEESWKALDILQRINF